MRLTPSTVTALVAAVFTTCAPPGPSAAHVRVSTRPEGWLVTVVTSPEPLRASSSLFPKASRTSMSRPALSNTYTLRSTRVSSQPPPARSFIVD